MLKVRSLALGALLVVGVATIAEAQASSTPRTSGERGAYGRDRGEMGKQRGHGRRAGRGFAFGKDLNLTEAQRTQITAIHRKYQPQYQSLRERARPFNEAARTARQNWDSVAYRTNVERARQVMAGAATIRNQELAEIRAVLTAEQRTKFDARQKEVADRRAKRKADGFRGRGPGKARPAAGGVIG